MLYPARSKRPTEGMYYPAPIGEEEDEEYWRDKLRYEQFCRERS